MPNARSFPFLTRRGFMAGVGATGLGVLAPGIARAAAALPLPPLLDAESLGNAIALTAAPSSARIAGDAPTQTWSYNGLPMLGPTLRLRRGQEVAMTVENRLPRTTSVHWHGLAVPSGLDGPFNPIAPGETWSPRLAIDQPAATLWYHPHPHGETSLQVQMGLAGLIIVEDEASGGLGLPAAYGLDDLPLVLQDRTFALDGSFAYEVTPIAVTHGSRGAQVLVNGALAPIAQVPRGVVRLRLLNGANARTFHLRFTDGRTFAVIAGDGGFLSAPVAATALTIASGERYEVLVDFADGSPAELVTAADDNGRFGTGMMDRMKSAVASLLPGETLPVVRFEPLGELAAQVTALPARLVPVPADPAGEPAARRRFKLDDAPTTETTGGHGAHTPQAPTAMGGHAGHVMTAGMVGSGLGIGINGRPYDPARIDFEVRAMSHELWTVEGGEMDHPFHVHGARLRLLARNDERPEAFEAGWKDTVLVPAAGTVELLVQFLRPTTDNKPFVYHCHILEHEDAGMMGQFLTV
jgi:blue copper oxidase